MSNEIYAIDSRLIHSFRRVSMPVARWGLFIIFFWFGLLKLLGLSPAGMLIENLYAKTIPAVPFSSFYTIFALLEIAIGVLFLIKGMERIVIPLLLLHMITTFVPLFSLPEISWQAPFVPTLTGQYIIKNLAIIAAAIGIVAHLHPIHRSK